MKKIIHANTNKKKAGVTILISDKVDFRENNITKDRNIFFVMTNGSID